MTAADYGVIENGVCTNMISLDPDQTDPVEFGHLINALLLPRINYLDGNWTIGAIWDGESITMPAPPPPPEVDPNQPPPAPPEPTQDDRIESKLDELLTLVRALGTGGNETPVETPTDPEPTDPPTDPTDPEPDPEPTDPEPTDPDSTPARGTRRR